MESCSTCVELHILTTHLQRGESGMWEVIGTGEWVALGRWKQRSQARGVVAWPLAWSRQERP